LYRQGGRRSRTGVLDILWMSVDENEISKNIKICLIHMRTTSNIIIQLALITVHVTKNNRLEQHKTSLTTKPAVRDV